MWLDRDGAVIAFQRSVGNMWPDTDPGGTWRAFRAADGGVRWSGQIP
jgi:hypothetical protein